MDRRLGVTALHLYDICFIARYDLYDWDRSHELIWALPSLCNVQAEDIAQ